MVKTPKGSIACEFTGGMKSPVRVRGSFITMDTEIQEALEKHPWFNQEFTVESTTPVEVKKPAEEPPKEEPPKEEEKPQGDQSGLLVSTASNVQQARSVLNKEYGVPFSKMKNTDCILEQAKIIGLQFPNWER